MTDSNAHRHLLMIELGGDDPVAAADRVHSALPDAQVWGDVDPVDAAILIIDKHHVLI